VTGVIDRREALREARRPMGTRTVPLAVGRRLAARALVLAAAAAVAACRTAVPATPLSLDVGTIEVVAADEPADVEMDHVTAGWAAGFGRGLVRGGEAIVVWPFGLGQQKEPPSSYELDTFGRILQVLAFPGNLLRVVVGSLVFKAVAVLWTPCSAVGGAVTAIPVDEADRAESTLFALAEDAGNSARLTEGFADRLRKGGRYSVDAGTADTRLEVRLIAIRRGRWRNWWTLDRPFRIEVEGEVRAIRRRDGATVWTSRRTVGSQGSIWDEFPRDEDPERCRRYLEWAEDGGVSFRKQLDERLAELGEALAIDACGAQAPETPAESR
jgi:hypothetical protein